MDGYHSYRRHDLLQEQQQEQQQCAGWYLKPMDLTEYYGLHKSNCYSLFKEQGDKLWAEP